MSRSCRVAIAAAPVLLARLVQHMATVLLIRHGTTAATGKRLGGRTEASLDERGREQAEAAGDRLAELPLKAVYASPLPRTLETAERIASRHGREVRPWEGLLEVEYGRWTNRPLKQLVRTKLWPVVQARPSLVRFPEGETIRGAQLRAVEGIEELVGRHRRDVIAAVSHADIIKAVVSFYLGQPLDLFQRLQIGPASVTALSLQPGGQPALVRFNDDGPLTREQFLPSQPKAKTTKGNRSG